MENWKNLLIVAYMKEGQESDSWKSKLEMLDLLIWSTLPKPTLKDRKKLVDMLPTLLSGIEEGMRMLSMSAADQDQFMEKLSGCHARLVNSEAQVMDITDKEPAMNTMAHQVMDITDKEPAVNTISKSDPPLDTPKAQEAETPIAEQAPHQLGSIMVEEVRVLGEDLQPSFDDQQQSTDERLDVHLNLFGEDSAGELAELAELARELEQESEQEQEQEQLDAAPETSVEDEWTELVRNMVPGIWFEFHHEDGSKSMERLAWISSVLGSYLFTNHDGLKSRELSAQELEDCLRSERAVLADDLSFLVDSSFNNLLDDMQKKIAG